MDRIGLPGQGLGDILLMTSVCKYIPDLTVEIKTYASRMSCLFDGMCKETIITDNPINSMPPPIGMTYIEALMNKFGLKDKKPLPYIKLTDNEKQDGIDFANQYKNPIIIITNSTLPYLRDMEHKKWLDIIEKLKDKYTFLQFGISNILPTKFDNVTQLLDVPIRKLACYYYGVGTYLGVDTGDRHLMSAVGGKTIVLHPNDNIEYSHKEWHYSKDIITYVNFNSYEQIYNLL